MKNMSIDQRLNSTMDDYLLPRKNIIDLSHRLNTVENTSAEIDQTLTFD